MTEFADVEKDLIERTWDGQLRWEVASDSSWVTLCGDLRILVFADGQIDVSSPSVRASRLGYSPDLVKELEQRKPLTPQLTEDELFKLTLEALEDCKGE